MGQIKNIKLHIVTDIKITQKIRRHDFVLGNTQNIQLQAHVTQQSG